MGLVAVTVEEWRQNLAGGLTGGREPNEEDVSIKVFQVEVMMSGITKVKSSIFVQTEVLNNDSL